MIEQVRLDIMRIVTGARRGTSHEALYAESGWNSLTQRRQTIKLINFDKIVCNDAPQYLINLLPQKIGDTRPESRIADNFRMIKSRTQVYKNSFIPSSINDWNNTKSKDRSRENWKNSLKYQPNYLFHYGDRALGVVHAQLRMKCSKLKAHLYSLHVTDSPACDCGYDREDANHFLLNCPLFANERDIMLNVITASYHGDVNCDLLLLGNHELSKETNEMVFKAVHMYIKETNHITI